MARVTVRVPSLLVPITGASTFAVDASTVADAIDGILEAQPGLRIHLYDERHTLRPHVRIFYNDADITWLDDLDAPATDGDTFTILQSVSGG